ncbi:hypothetical protein B7494_g917 [Chlorociboria aeruginascens]|nr:hypothetical protein B7494_g917 [Chlorociboria aeruginascens]
MTPVHDNSYHHLDLGGDRQSIHRCHSFPFAAFDNPLASRSQATIISMELEKRNPIAGACEQPWPTSDNPWLVEDDSWAGMLTDAQPAWEPMSPSELERQKADDERDRIMESVKGWPWTGIQPQLVTLAPYLKNEYPGTRSFVKVAVQQASLLLKFLGGATIPAKKTLDLIFEHHSTASALSLACQHAWNICTAAIQHWDMTSGFFQNCEHSKWGTPSKPGYRDGSVSSVVIVTPIRHQKGPLTFTQQMNNLHTMCRAMSNFARFFRNIQLHRVPFLTVDVLSLVIPHLTNLTSLGIYKCELIHLADGLRLLEIIRTDRPLGKENQVSLDWFPNYHTGPDYLQPGDTRYTGSYGVTWDDCNGLDTRLAIWKLAEEILLQAGQQMIDFESPHAAFRQWLDKSPCWKVADTLKTITDLDATAQDVIAMVDYPHLSGQKENIYIIYPNRPQGWAWTAAYYPCSSCHKDVLGIFFNYAQIREARNTDTPFDTADLTCMGCKLAEILNSETDHYKHHKRHAIAAWLREEEEWNERDLTKALCNTFRAIRATKPLDKRRAFDLKCGKDRIGGECQREGDPSWLLRHGCHERRSPTVHEKDPKKSQWTWFREDRIFAHGYNCQY